ncbi:TPA: 50S ribosomal protein L17 [bacterium]|nr:50S ribosomal protein L17 [bacterium]
MRHRKKHLKFGKGTSYRKALLSNLATELFRHRMIKTTYTKAKAVSSFAERLISFAKKQNLTSYRYVISHLKDKEVAKKLFVEIAKDYQYVPSGYTSILKLAPRHGDASKMAVVFLKESKQPPLPQKEEEEESKTSS